MLGQFSPEDPGAAALAHLPRSGIRAYLELPQMEYDFCLGAAHCHEGTTDTVRFVRIFRLCDMPDIYMQDQIEDSQAVDVELSTTHR